MIPEHFFNDVSQSQTIFLGQLGSTGKGAMKLPAPTRKTRPAGPQHLELRMGLSLLVF